MFFAICATELDAFIVSNAANACIHNVEICLANFVERSVDATTQTLVKVVDSYLDNEVDAIVVARVR